MRLLIISVREVGIAKSYDPQNGALRPSNSQSPAGTHGDQRTKFEKHPPSVDFAPPHSEQTDRARV